MVSTIHERIGKALFEQDVPDFSRFDWLFALDIGGGNCSLAAVDLRPDADHTPRLLKLSGRGETSLWSNIGYDALPGETGSVSIGKRSQNRKYQFSNYKIVPTDQNLQLEVSPDNHALTGDFQADAAVRRSIGELTRDYLRELFQTIVYLPENGDLCRTPLDRILMIAGHPSSDDWKNEQAHRNLVSIVREATGVSAVLTTSESNAAILYALNSRRQIGQADKILIVDLGAYSADVTWIDRLNLERRYASMALGGKSVDQTIARIILQNSGRDRSQLDEDYNLIYEARNIKEQFWPRGDMDQRTYLKASGEEVSVLITAAQFDQSVREIPFSVLDPVTGQDADRSYTGHLSAFLESARTDLGITQVDWVLVTGGAARMKPAMEVIRRKAEALWNVRDEHVWPSVIADSLIDESVPFGSLQFCLKSRDVLDGIPGVCDKLKDEAAKMVSPMAQRISGDILDHLMPNAIGPVLRRFRDTTQIPSIEALEAALTAELQREEHKQQIRDLTDKAAKSVATDHKAGFQEIITDFLEELYGRKASDVTWNWNTSIDPDVVFDGSVVQTIQKAVTQAVEDSLLDILLGIIFLLSVGLYLIAYIVVATVDTIVENWRKKHWSESRLQQWEQERQQKQLRKEQEKEREKQQKEQEERRKTRSQNERKKIYNKVMSEDTKEKLREDVQRKIHDQLKHKCDENGFGVPGAYLEQLTEDICNAVYTGL